MEGEKALICTEMTIRALNIAERAHHGQYDKSGAAYILHPITVASMCDTEDETTVALLHDVIEDTAVTAQDLRDAGFPERIVGAVEALTHADGEEYMEYVGRVCECPLARAVKMRDLRHNMDLSRLAGKKITEKDEARRAKYQAAYRMCAEASAMDTGQ